MLMRRDCCEIRRVAQLLGRVPSTISRELRRQAERGKLRDEAPRAAARAFAESRRCRNRRKLRPGRALFEWRRVICGAAGRLPAGER